MTQVWWEGPALIKPFEDDTLRSNILYLIKVRSGRVNTHVDTFVTFTYIIHMFQANGLAALAADTKRHQARGGGGVLDFAHATVMIHGCPAPTTLRYCRTQRHTDFVPGLGGPHALVCRKKRNACQAPPCKRTGDLICPLHNLHHRHTPQLTVCHGVENYAKRLLRPPTSLQFASIIKLYATTHNHFVPRKAYVRLFLYIHTPCSAATCLTFRHA